ncbi:MAG: phospholipase D-like domain-containing protein [Candidatus Bathyarchaeia archaeon]
MDSEWERFRDRIVGLQNYLSWFKADFLDRDDFKKFANTLQQKVGGFKEICITGYFSEDVVIELERIINYGKTTSIDTRVRLLCPDLDVKIRDGRIEGRDRRNLQALEKIVRAGAEVKVNIRMHARFLVAYTPSPNPPNGLLVIGSFDFNKEGMSRERYDAGIMTRHPDLVNSAIDLFEQIWSEEQSEDLLRKYEGIN